MPEIKTVRVKPNSPKTRIVSETDSELIVEVAAPAENNKANIELIKFLSKKFSKNVRIIRGLKSKKKLISV
jgi:uncharacterized protein (TIGR00251 family)